MDQELVEAWVQYRTALLDLYRGEVTVRLLDADDEVAASLARRAGELSAAFGERLLLDGEAPDDAYELETAVLAAAALDVAVASELLLAIAGEGIERDMLWPERLAGPVEIPTREELEPVPVLLWRAESAFGEDMPVGAGAAPDFSSVEARAQGAIEQILSSCVPTSVVFARGMLLAEVETLRAGLHMFAGLGEVPVGGRRFRIGAGLLLAAVEKLLALTKTRLGSNLVSHFGLQGLSGGLEAKLERFSMTLVRNVVRADEAERQVEGWLQGKQPAESETIKLDTRLSVLCLRYERNMHSAKTIGNWMRYCSPGVVLVGGVVRCKILVAAMNGAGLAYSLHSCGDRLETLKGWVPGVPVIVEAEIG